MQTYTATFIGTLTSITYDLLTFKGVFLQFYWDFIVLSDGSFKFQGTVTMVTTIIKYSSNFLKAIGSLWTLNDNFPYFLVEPEVRSNIINLGIRTYKRPYRRSRAGKNLFFKIHTVLTQWRKTRSTKCDMGSNLSNLIEVRTMPVTNKSAHTCQLKCELLNCHSIVNKIQDLHIELCTNNINVCALTETWIKEDDMLTLNRMCPKGYDSISIQRSDKAGGGLAVAYKKDLNV